MTLPLSSQKYPLSPGFMELTFYMSIPQYGVVMHFLNYIYIESYCMYFMSGFLCSGSSDASTVRCVAVLVNSHFLFPSYKPRAMCSSLQMPMSTWDVSSLGLLEQCPGTLAYTSWSVSTWGAVGHIPRSGAAGSQSTATIMAHCFLKCRSNLHSHQQSVGLPVAPWGRSQSCLFPSRMAQTMFNIHLLSYWTDSWLWLCYVWRGWNPFVQILKSLGLRSTFIRKELRTCHNN